MKMDGSFLPADAARPEPRRRIDERLEGKQVAQVHWVQEDTPDTWAEGEAMPPPLLHIGPSGSPVCAVELTTGEKWIIMAGRDRDSRYTARILFSWMNRPRIVTPKMAKAFSRGRYANPFGAKPDDWQERIEGAVIRGVLHSTKPTSWGGEQMGIEMTGGGRLVMAAFPCLERHGAGLIIADLDLRWCEPERTLIAMPGGAS